MDELDLLDELDGFNYDSVNTDPLDEADAIDLAAFDIYGN